MFLHKLKIYWITVTFVGQHTSSSPIQLNRWRPALKSNHVSHLDVHHKGLCCKGTTICHQWESFANSCRLYLLLQCFSWVLMDIPDTFPAESMASCCLQLVYYYMIRWPGPVNQLILFNMCFSKRNWTTISNHFPIPFGCIGKTASN